MNDKLTILLIEDDDVAAEAIVRSLKKQGVEAPILHAENGVQALKILRDSAVERARHPFVALLDLNMPVMNGFEFLKEVRSDPELGGLVVFVLTTSDADIDRSRAYQHHVAGYMVKSAVGPQFSVLARLLDEYSKAVMLI